MLRKFFVAGSAMAFSLISFGQEASVTSTTTSTAVAEEKKEEEKKPFLSITGSADVYYRYDFAKTKFNNLTSFTGTQNSFSLGMASVKFEHKSDKVGVVADLGFGPRAREFAYADEGITQAIKQLYVSYSPAEWLKLTAGTWATHVGYELVDPQLNRNYSMSYMFTNGPFTHTGVKAEITKGKHGVMVGLSNATDYRIPPESMINKKFLIAQYSVAFTENVKLYLNYVGGKNPDSSKTNQFDAVLAAKVSDKFSLGLNGTVNSNQAWDGDKNADGQSWWGSAIYLNVDPKPWFGLTLRGELFNDKNQLKMFSSAPDGGNIFATTLSANFKTGGFIFIPELRFENASEDIFYDKDLAPKKNYASFIVAAIYSF
ncbi:MAG: porin [Chitinophagaceae bacterium]|nr:porin [Chitinophagaceae bacterium]